MRHTGHSRGLIRQVLRGHRNDVFRSRKFVGALSRMLDAQWTAGERNGTGLWRRLRPLGFRGSRRVVGEWVTRRKRADKADAESLTRIPSAPTIARLLTTSRGNLTKSETVIIAAIESGVPLLVAARLPSYDPTQIGKRARIVGRPRLRQSGCLLWQWRCESDTGSPRSDRLNVVQWINRRADHQAQARKTPHLRSRKA